MSRPLNPLKIYTKYTISFRSMEKLREAGVYDPSTDRITYAGTQPTLYLLSDSIPVRVIFDQKDDASIAFEYDLAEYGSLQEFINHITRFNLPDACPKSPSAENIKIIFQY